MFLLSSIIAPERLAKCRMAYVSFCPSVRFSCLSFDALRSPVAGEQRVWNSSLGEACRILDRKTCLLIICCARCFCELSGARSAVMLLYLLCGSLTVRRERFAGLGSFSASGDFLACPLVFPSTFMFRVTGLEALAFARL